MKPKGVLKTLHPSRQLQVWHWLNGDPVEDVPPLTQKQTIARIKEEFGVTVLPSTLSDFYAWYPFREQLMAAQDLLSEVKHYIASNPDLDLDSDRLSKAAQIINEKRAIEAKDPKLHIALRKLRQKDRDQEAVERRLKLLEQREEKAKDVLNNEKLTPEEKDAKMRAVFGLQPKA